MLFLAFNSGSDYSDLVNVFQLQLRRVLCLVCLLIRSLHASSSYLRLGVCLSDWLTLDSCFHRSERERKVHEGTMILVDLSCFLCAVDIQKTALVLACGKNGPFCACVFCVYSYVYGVRLLVHCLRNPGRDQTVAAQCESLLRQQ